MILKLRNNKIEILQNDVPDNIKNIQIYYDFEYGTNHLSPVLNVMGNVYNGKSPMISLNKIVDNLDMVVYLCDHYGTIIKTYKGSFICYNMLRIGDANIINIHKELERVYSELKKIKEIGEVI